MTATGAASSKAHYVAREDHTSRAGAVYLFSRLVVPSTGAAGGETTNSSSSPTTPVCSEEGDSGQLPEVRRFYCPRGGERGQPYCGWEESAKLTASDRRGGDLFGRCLSVDHDSGIVVVGAPGASLTGLWREVRIVRGGCGKFNLRGRQPLKRVLHPNWTLFQTPCVCRHPPSSNLLRQPQGYPRSFRPKSNRTHALRHKNPGNPPYDHPTMCKRATKPSAAFTQL